MAVISHFPATDKGSIGYLDYSVEERKKLAEKSRSFVCDCCKLSNEQLIQRVKIAEENSAQNISNTESVTESQKTQLPSEVPSSVQKNVSKTRSTQHAFFGLAIVLCSVLLLIYSVYAVNKS